MTSRAPRGNALLLYRELWRFAKGERVKLLAAMMLLAGAQVMLLGIPYLSGHAINTLQLRGVGGLTTAGGWLLLVLGVTLGSWLLHGPARILERNVALRIRERMSALLIERLLALPLSWHESHHSAETTHRIQQSTHALCGFAQSQFIYLSSAVRLIGPVIALWMIKPVVGLAAIVGFVLISVSVLGFDRAMIRLAHQENDAERRYASALVDTLGNTSSLFALRQGRGVLTLLQRRLLATFEPLKRSIVLNEAKWCVVDVASKTLSCLLVALFAWLIARDAQFGLQRTVLLGSIYMVWEYALQAGGVISAIASHFQAFARQQADYASADAIVESAPAPAVDSAAAPVAAWRHLNVRELSFRHAASRKDVLTLDHLSFALERGKRYALIGGSGSGKSTLLRVLAGLYVGERVAMNRDHGPAIVSAVEAARFLRTTATLIPQDAEVFEGTLAENLSLCESIEGPPLSTEYPQALQLARASEFIDTTPAGLDADIAERGANWSGGQRSRIALARGILAARGSSLVLLDEPTAALDSKTEGAVYDNLFAVFKDACVISSIHRLNLLGRFDEVLVMHEGKLVAQGTVATLQARSPEFRQLLAAHQHEADHAPSATDAAGVI